MVRASADDLTLRDDGLQLEEPRRFQERFWIAERVASLCYLAVVAVALAGLTGGGGPLSRDSEAFADGRVDYPRIARWQASDSLTVDFDGSGGERSLTLSRAFAERFRLDDVQPQPSRSEAGPAGQRLVFELRDGAPARVILHLRAERPGLARFDVALDDRPAQRLSTLILP